MLLVISNPTAVTDEATIINGLFGEGLEIFHLRKPGMAISEIDKLMEKIQPAYYQQNQNTQAFQQPQQQYR